MCAVLLYSSESKAALYIVTKIQGLSETFKDQITCYHPAPTQFREIQNRNHTKSSNKFKTIQHGFDISSRN